MNPVARIMTRRQGSFFAISVNLKTRKWKAQCFEDIH